MTWAEMLGAVLTEAGGLVLGPGDAAVEQAARSRATRRMRVDGSRRRGAMSDAVPFLARVVTSRGAGDLTPVLAWLVRPGAAARIQ